MMTSDIQVALGLMTDHLVEVETMKSILFLLAEEQPCFQGRVIIEKGNIGRLDRGRNDVIRAFGTTGAEWLLFVDSDMVFTSADFRKLAVRANPKTAPILSGLYFKDSDPPLPVIYDWDESGRAKHTELLGNPVQTVGATGMGFMLVHLSVFDTIYHKAFNLEEPWCDNGQKGPAGQPLADDMSFCYRASQCGFPIKVVTSARIGHIKTHILYG